MQIEVDFSKYIPDKADSIRLLLISKNYVILKYAISELRNTKN